VLNGRRGTKEVKIERRERVGGKGRRQYTLGVGREPSELPSYPFDPSL
jgi:hypothetical protein